MYSLNDKIMIVKKRIDLKINEKRGYNLFNCSSYVKRLPK